MLRHPGSAGCQPRVASPGLPAPSQRRGAARVPGPRCGGPCEAGAARWTASRLYSLALRGTTPGPLALGASVCSPTGAGDKGVRLGHKGWMRRFPTGPSQRVPLTARACPLVAGISEHAWRPRPQRTAGPQGGLGSCRPERAQVVATYCHLESLVAVLPPGTVRCPQEGVVRRPRPGAGPPRPAALPGGHVQGVDDEPRVAQVAGPRNKYQQSQGHRVTGGREGQGHGTERWQEEPWAGDAPSGPTRPRRTGTGSRVRMPAALTERREKLPHGDQPEEPPRQEEVCQLTPEDRAGRGGHERQRGQDPALRGGGHGEAGTR